MDTIQGRGKTTPQATDRFENLGDVSDTLVYIYMTVFGTTSTHRPVSTLANTSGWWARRDLNPHILSNTGT
jgi:hypothetical protein